MSEHAILHRCPQCKAWAYYPAQCAKCEVLTAPCMELVSDDMHAFMQSLRPLTAGMVIAFPP
jgi:hypothetical protein